MNQAEPAITPTTNAAADQAQTIALSLVSHTNAGKTTLARTLLGQDVGTVRDESHVTEAAELFTMVTTTGGDALQLWDTPGFGDSARLAKRLENSENPLGWLVGQVWDRFSDRAIYSSQQAVRNVREHADIVLYLVNAAEDPADASYVEPEMRVLAWTGKPVIVLLNQMGPPQPAEVEAAELQNWRDHLADQPMVHKILALDAFARCWVQEGELLNDIAPLIGPDRQGAYERLRDKWFSDRRQVFDNAIGVLAHDIARAAADIEQVADGGFASRLREVGATVGVGSSEIKDGRDAAMVAMAQRWDNGNRATRDTLIALHGLSGAAAEEVLTRVDAHYAVHRRVSEGKAAVLGGVATGALAGLKADLATGGLTLGGGMIAGSIIGALGAAGLARGYNTVRGINSMSVQWSEQVLLNKTVSAILTYLAVAHFGRGRGNWSRSEYPAHWMDTVQQAVDDNKSRFTSAWKARAKENGENLVSEPLRAALSRTTLEILTTLYPNSRVPAR